MNARGAGLDSPARLDIHTSAEDLRFASEWLERECVHRDVPAEQIMRLDLCLNEAIANVMAHGGKAAALTPVHLTLMTEAEASTRHAELCIVDAGQPFNPLVADIPQAADTLAEASIGGLGLLMIGNCADELGYEYRDGRNHLRVTVRWGGALP